MTTDDLTAHPPADDAPEADDDAPKAADDALDVLPGWVQTTVEELRADAEEPSRLVLWLPVLSAAWGAGRRAVALGTALRANVESDQSLEWPDELASELATGLAAFAEAVPPLEEAVPALSELVDLGQDHIDPELARGLVVDALSRAETLGERAVRALLDTAFFAPEATDLAQRTRHLHQLFTRLEALFDRALQIWLNQQP